MTPQALDSPSFGLHVGALPDDDPHGPELVEFASFVERCGFNSLWMGEHLLWRVGFLDPLLALSALAATTDHLVVGTSVLILPLHHPLPLAKAASTLDSMSTGRFVLGVGVGGENPNEFAAMGVDLHQRGKLADEAVALMRRLWTEDGVVHPGPAYPCVDATVRPRPVTPGGPPIWIGGRSEAAQTRAGRIGDGWLPYLVSPGQYAQGLNRVTRTREKNGSHPRGFTPAVHLFAAVDAHGNGHRLLGDFFERLYIDRLERILDSTCLIGHPEACAQRIHQYWQAGARHFMLQVPGWGPDVVNQIQEVGHQLVPLAIEMIAKGPSEVVE